MIAHIYVYNNLYMYMYIYIPPKLIFAKLFRRPEFFAGYSFPKAACDLLSPRHLPGPAQYPGVRADEGLGRHLSPAAHLPGLGNAATGFSPGAPTSRCYPQPGTKLCSPGLDATGACRLPPLRARDGHPASQLSRALSPGRPCQ